MEIEINGIKYQRKEQVAAKPMSKMMSTLLAISIIFDGPNPNQRIIKREPSVNLIEEFKLIQNKKSKLSRNERESVVYRFNRFYKIIEE